MKRDFRLLLNALFFSEMLLIELSEVGVHPFLAWGRLLVGRPFLFRRLSRSQPRKPALPARERVAIARNDRRALFRDDVSDFVRRYLWGFKEV